jgi:hypothetical protein
MTDVLLLTGRRWRSLIDDIIAMERDAMGGLGPFERDWIIHRRSPERVRSLLGRATLEPGIVAQNSTFASPVGLKAAAPSSFPAVASTNVETNLWTPAIWSPIPAGDMTAGTVYKNECGGIFSTSSAAPTSIWTPRVGQSAAPSSNVTMGASTATTMIASLSNVPFFSQFTFTIRALGLAAAGASGTGNGFVVIGGITTATGVVQSIGSTVASTIDNTAASGYILSQTWGTNNASNTLTCQWVSPVYSLN